jgi:transcriptional regulator with XRE-family HTH domain
VTEIADHKEQEQTFRRALAKRIQSLRHQSGVGQEDFADRALIHRTHVGMLENAKIDPKLSTLLRVAAALGISVWELLNLEQDLQPQEPLKVGRKRKVRAETDGS